jgi:hypothetical protein
MGILLNMTGNPSESENKNKKLQNNALKNEVVITIISLVDWAN